MDADRYLERIGIDPATVTEPDRETLARLQAAHVRSIPFETLAITGDPFDDADDGAGVSLALPALYEKIVDAERGGFCFELNGLFGWLLEAVGFDADRVAARIVSDGDSRPPANHHTHLVDLDETVIVDVGMAVPALRRPLALDGSVVEDAAGVAWRAVESDRPNADYSVQYRTDGEFEERYFFRTTPRELRYFRATCEYLATDPESGFTGDPVVTRATADGHLKLTPGELTRRSAGERTRRPVDADEFHALLEREFGLRY